MKPRGRIRIAAVLVAMAVALGACAAGPEPSGTRATPPAVGVDPFSGYPTHMGR
jgi:hypothetical protein